MQRTRFVSLFAFSARPFGRSLALLLLFGASAAVAQTPSPAGGPTGGQAAGRKLAGDTVGFTLTEAINYGLDNAVSMRQAVLTMQEAKERKREVLARGLPQLSAALGYTHYVSLPVSSELYGICTLAAILLLFMVGLETDMKLFLRYSLAGSLVGVGGVVVAFLAGDLLVVAFSPMRTSPKSSRRSRPRSGHRPTHRPDGSARPSARPRWRAGRS